MGEHADLAIEHELAMEFGFGQFEDEERTWKTQDGRTLLIKDMDTNHIENCINHLSKRGQYDPYLEQELEQREDK